MPCNEGVRCIQYFLQVILGQMESKKFHADLKIAQPWVICTVSPSFTTLICPVLGLLLSSGLRPHSHNLGPQTGHITLVKTRKYNTTASQCAVNLLSKRIVGQYVSTSNSAVLEHLDDPRPYGLRTSGRSRPVKEGRMPSNMNSKYYAFLNMTF